MKTVKMGGKEVKLYDSIDEMPVTNFQKYNKYLLIDSGVGSDVDDIDGHITKLARLITADEKAKALQELQNMRQNIYMVNSMVSPRHMAFAALIHSVDGEKVDDLSDDGLKDLLERLRGAKRSQMVELLEGLKKKRIRSLKRIFRTSSPARRRKRPTTR